MDTREKVIEIEGLPSLLSQGKWTAVTGLFDPLTLEQAERIAASAGKGRRILAAVAPETASLMTADARAALVASLREVSAVVIADARRLVALCSDLPNVHINDDEPGERRRSIEFVNFILRRQQSAGILA